ncbi:hypothetical protein FRC06_011408 [Ceratobasidium sp. 370]|nr:hypothetical protein FRC06_011408 [Ceratobasidium sp. 370]
MRRAPSSRVRQNDALRNSVFDAAQEIGLAGPNALQWLEQNANISEEDEEEEEVKREPRPPSDTHPPSLVFSSSSSEPDSSINSPSNDHSTNFRAPYPRPTTKAHYQAYAQSQFHTQPYQPSLQPQVDTRLPIDPSSRNSPNPLARPPPASLGLKIPDPWPPTQLSIASLSPLPQSTTRAPTPADTINSKQGTEPKKARKLTKAHRVDIEPEAAPARKVSGGEHGNSGLGGVSPMLPPVLPFPSAISGETLSSDASVSGLSTISGSSLTTVTQPGAVFPEQATQSILFPPTPTANERSVFEDDNDDERPTFSTIPSSSTTVTASNHKPNAPSTSTAASAEAPSANSKEGKNSVLRVMRSFKLSLKGQKAPKLPLPEAPPVPTVSSLPPVLTLKLGQGSAGLAEDLQSRTNEERKTSQEKEREERALKLAEHFKPSELGPNTSSVYTTQSSEAGVRSDVGHVPSDHGHSHPAGPQSDQGHAPIRVAGGGGGFWSANVGTKKDWANKPPRAVKGRRMSVDEANGAGEAEKKETVKVTERTRAGTVGTRNGHTRTRSKSGDFSGAGWEKSSRPPVPNGSKGSKAPKATVKRIANPDPISPKLSFDSQTRHSLERAGFGARGEHDEIRALDVQHQLQSFVASMRGAGGEDEEDVQGGFSRASEESFDQRVGPPRVRGNDSDTLRSSGDYDPDPFRAFVGKPRSITVPLPRPESEAIPHQLVIPAYSIPKEVGQTSVPTIAPTPKRAAPPTAFKPLANVSPAGGAQTSTAAASPSIVVGGSGERSSSADTTSKVGQSGHSRPGSRESELGLGYSGFGFARTAATADNNDASEEWVVPSPSWAPLEPKRGHSPGPDTITSETQPRFLGVRPDRQRASGLSIPRSVTPDSPMPAQLGSAMLLAPSRSVTPLATQRSITPLAVPRSVTPLGAAKSPFVPLVSRSLTPQPQTEQAGGDRLSRERDITPPQRQGTAPLRQPLQPEERNTPSPTIPRRALPVRTSSISSVSSGDQSLGHRSHVRSPPPRIVVPSPVPGPRSAQAALMPRSMTSTPISRSATSTPLSRGPVPRSMSTTPTPRASEEEQPLRHEAFSRFLAPETIPAAQKRGRVSPFPTRPVREPDESREYGANTAAAEPRSSWETPEESQPGQREKYPGGGEKYGSNGLMQLPRVRFIGVRSSNGSSQAGWQGRIEDMRREEPPARIGSWVEYEEDGSRPVSWEGGFAYDQDPAYDGATQEYDEVRHPAYTDEPLEDDTRSTMPPTPMDPEANPDVVAAAGTLRPSEPRYPGWAVDAPASRASTFTIASEYDDGEPIPPVPNTQKLAAAVRGMSQGTWSRGRI